MINVGMSNKFPIYSIKKLITKKRTNVTSTEQRHNRVKSNDEGHNHTDGDHDEPNHNHGEQIIKLKQLLKILQWNSNGLSQHA